MGGAGVTAGRGLDHEAVTWGRGRAELRTRLSLGVGGARLHWVQSDGRGRIQQHVCHRSA